MTRFHHVSPSLHDKVFTVTPPISGHLPAPPTPRRTPWDTQRRATTCSRWGPPCCGACSSATPVSSLIVVFCHFCFFFLHLSKCKPRRNTNRCHHVEEYAWEISNTIYLSRTTDLWTHRSTERMVFHGGVSRYPCGTPHLPRPVTPRSSRSTRGPWSETLSLRPLKLLLRPLPSLLCTPY